ncbi:hypothetical protein AUC47_04865 [Microbacterium sp. SZ1]|uniref:hypothetical protein n=1 Tax=Microbacterium sp. SZ1 TaxID=1849736 RepID=UPI000BBCF0A6|nr:hypothetical protein [Microbacterium sp. SZ1]PCE13982.1 hypothetical protein AUC47_04865 [Microbacterium sp. SZ1]
MNKQVIFIIIAILAGIGLVGVFALQLIRPDATATLINFLFQLLMLLGGFGGLAAMQAQQNKEIETIKTNTNGTLSRKDEEIAALRATLAEHAPQALVETDTAAIPITRAQLRQERESD